MSGRNQPTISGGELILIGLVRIFEAAEEERSIPAQESAPRQKLVID
jgi:hypothetical protein